MPEFNPPPGLFHPSTSVFISCQTSGATIRYTLDGSDPDATSPEFWASAPIVVTADAFDPEQPHAIRSYVNGKLRQNGDITDMIFHCASIVSTASHYFALSPGDLIFTGTPSGVALEGGHNNFPWLKPGDTVDVEIEGIGTLHNRMA